MNVHTSPKRVLCSTILTWQFFSLFYSFEKYGSLNVRSKIWIAEILSNLNVNNSKHIKQSIWTYIPFERKFYALQILLASLFSFNASFKSYGGLNLIIKVWIVKFDQTLNVNNWETIRAKYVSLHSLRERILCSTNFKQDFFFFFQSLRRFGGLNVIIKIWIFKILSNFKYK